MQPATTKPLAKNLALFLGVILLISITGTFAVYAAFTVTDGIYAGVKIGDIDVGGLSLPEAEAKIAENIAKRITQAPVSLTYQKQTWELKAEDIDLSVDAASLAKQAYEIGRRGNIFARIQERYLTINQGHVIPLAPSFQQSKLLAIITFIANSVDKEPKNATLSLTRTGIAHTPEMIGYKVDIPKTLSDITAGINSRIPCIVPLTVQTLPPAVTAKDVRDIDSVIAAYTTQFDPTDQNRSQNIALAAKSINGVVLKSDETFSFNQQVGPRLSQYGYQIAPVFINGKLTPDWGGGVCQVSSTLYNATLLADMAVVERTSHYRPPGYVPLGQDATVADNALDFKFKNTSSTNIYILSEVADNQITVFLLGRQSDAPPDIQIVATDRKVIEPNTIVRQDPELELGKEIVEEPGQKGFQVTTYRVKYVNGKETAREFLASDDFPPETKIVRVGTKTPQQKTK